MPINSEQAILSSFILSLPDFMITEEHICSYHHMGAILSDTVLQAGINYKTVVFPRIQRILNTYPEGNVTSRFLKIIDKYGVNQVLKWNDSEKPRRLSEITLFFHAQNIETEIDLNSWLRNPMNCTLLMNIRGVGPKTIDYLKNLVNFPSIAVDRHIRSFVNSSGLNGKTYQEMKSLLQETAYILNVSQSSLDYAIWSYMVNKSPKVHKNVSVKVY